MTAKELMEKYPHTTKVIKDYFLDILVKNLDSDLPEEFKAHVKQVGIEDVHIEKILEEAPRSLFDVFDEYGIFISMKYEPQKESFKVDVFSTSSDGVGYFIGDFINSDRKGGELAAIEKAFEILEHHE